MERPAPQDVGKPYWSSDDVFASADFPFAILTADPQPPDQLHDHRGFSEIAVIYRGAATHCTELEAYPVRAGDVFFITGDLRHGYRDVDDLHLKNLCFDSARILAYNAHLRKLPGFHALFRLEPKYRSSHRFESRLKLNPEDLGHVLGLIAAMEEELEQRREGYEVTVIALFLQAISFMCRRYAKSHHPTSRHLMRMGAVIGFIETHYAEGVDIERLQEIAQLSYSALIKNFKEATGLSPIEYLLRVRIARAIEMMRNPSISVTDIAFAVGFSDSNYFARQFKQIMSMSPTEYRRTFVHLT